MNILKVPKHPSGATPRNLGKRSGAFFIQHGNEAQTGSRSFSPLNKEKKWFSINDLKLVKITFFCLVLVFLAFSGEKMS